MLHYSLFDRDQIRALCLARSLEKIAAEVGIHPRTLRRYLQGRDVMLSNVERLTHYFERLEAEQEKVRLGKAA
jgi:AcrR family transcriptional regulator